MSRRRQVIRAPGPRTTARAAPESAHTIHCDGTPEGDTPAGESTDVMTIPVAVADPFQRFYGAATIWGLISSSPLYRFTLRALSEPTGDYRTMMATTGTNIVGEVGSSQNDAVGGALVTGSRASWIVPVRGIENPDDPFGDWIADPSRPDTILVDVDITMTTVDDTPIELTLYWTDVSDEVLHTFELTPTGGVVDETVELGITMPFDPNYGEWASTEIRVTSALDYQITACDLQLHVDAPAASEEQIGQWDDELPGWLNQTANWFTKRDAYILATDENSSSITENINVLPSGAPNVSATFTVLQFGYIYYFWPLGGVACTWELRRTRDGVTDVIDTVTVPHDIVVPDRHDALYTDVRPGDEITVAIANFAGGDRILDDTDPTLILYEYQGYSHETFPPFDEVYHDDAFVDPIRGWAVQVGLYELPNNSSGTRVTPLTNTIPLAGGTHEDSRFV